MHLESFLFLWQPPSHVRNPRLVAGVGGQKLRRLVGEAFVVPVLARRVHAAANAAQRPGIVAGFRGEPHADLVRLAFLDPRVGQLAEQTDRGRKPIQEAPARIDQQARKAQEAHHDATRDPFPLVPGEIVCHFVSQYARDFVFGFCIFEQPGQHKHVIPREDKRVCLLRIHNGKRNMVCIKGGQIVVLCKSPCCQKNSPSRSFHNLVSGMVLGKNIVSVLFHELSIILITHAFLGLGVRCDPSATPGQWGKVLKSEIEEKSSNDWKAPRDVHVGRNVLLVFIATAAIVSVSCGSMFDGDTIGLFIVLDALLLPGRVEKASRSTPCLALQKLPRVVCFSRRTNMLSP
mmetsp:Transcript_23803/g.56055  ORF Transcript_23803/g.56055 Transcript_23803/m.56055 type:complete len:346 (+) Transcript_23803:422-1459(+)